MTAIVAVIINTPLGWSCAACEKRATLALLRDAPGTACRVPHPGKPIRHLNEGPHPLLCPLTNPIALHPSPQRWLFAATQAGVCCSSPKFSRRHTHLGELAPELTSALRAVSEGSFSALRPIPKTSSPSTTVPAEALRVLPGSGYDFLDINRAPDATHVPYKSQG